MRREKAQVNGGGADMGIRERSLPAIFFCFVNPRHSHAQTNVKNINIKCRHTLALVTTNTLREQCVFCGFFVK